MALVMDPAGINTYDVGAFDAKTYFAELLRKVKRWSNNKHHKKWQACCSFTR